MKPIKNQTAFFSGSQSYRPFVKMLFSTLAVWFTALSMEAQQVTPTPVPPEVLPAGTTKFIVPTKSKENPLVPFYVREPASYRTNPTQKIFRVLLTCPIRGQDGLKNLSSNNGLRRLADERGWFMVSPTFKQGREDTNDRKLCYYYPETYSGKAVLDALDLIQKKYPIATNGLLLLAYSGGAQFIHRFALWAPDRVDAAVVNSSSWFDDPNERSQAIGWLVTIGEADPSYDKTLAFVAKLKQKGALPILRSYIGMTHDRKAEFTALESEFLKFYDDLTRSKLGAKIGMLAQKPQPILRISEMPWVGDAQECSYVKNTPDALEEIAEDERVYLPTEALAKAWGTQE